MSVTCTYLYHYYIQLIQYVDRGEYEAQTVEEDVKFLQVNFKHVSDPQGAPLSEIASGPNCHLLNVDIA